ncbi:hypothetical protein D3C80_946640 [compost metagenome]
MNQQVFVSGTRFFIETLLLTVVFSGLTTLAGYFLDPPLSLWWLLLAVPFHLCLSISILDMSGYVMVENEQPRNIMNQSEFLARMKDVLTTMMIAAPIACLMYVLLALFAGLIAGEILNPFIPHIIGAGSGFAAFYAVDRFRKAKRQGNDS